MPPWSAHAHAAAPTRTHTHTHPHLCSTAARSAPTAPASAAATASYFRRAPAATARAATPSLGVVITRWAPRWVLAGCNELVGQLMRSAVGCNTWHAMPLVLCSRCCCRPAASASRSTSCGAGTASRARISVHSASSASPAYRAWLVAHNWGQGAPGAPLPTCQAHGATASCRNDGPQAPPSTTRPAVCGRPTIQCVNVLTALHNAAPPWCHAMCSVY